MGRFEATRHLIDAERPEVSVIAGNAAFDACVSTRHGRSPGWNASRPRSDRHRWAMKDSNLQP
jgi:hypothetical protein